MVLGKSPNIFRQKFPTSSNSSILLNFLCLFAFPLCSIRAVQVQILQNDKKVAILISYSCFWSFMQIGPSHPCIIHPPVMHFYLDPHNTFSWFLTLRHIIINIKKWQRQILENFISYLSVIQAKVEIGHRL